MTNHTPDPNQDRGEETLGAPATLSRSEASEHIDRLQKGNPRTDGA